MIRKRQTVKALILHMARGFRVRIWHLGLPLTKKLIRTNSIARRKFMRIFGIAFPRQAFPKPTDYRRTSTIAGDPWKRLLAGMAEAGTLDLQGHYRSAVAIRLEVLSDSYRLIGLDPDTHFPTSLAPAHSSNIGHIGIAGAIAHANRNGRVPRHDRIQPIKQIGNRQAIEALSSSFKQVHLDTNLNSLSSLMSSLANYDYEPSLWPFMERLNTIRTSSGFKDLYEFLEELGADFPAQRDTSPFSVRDSYHQGVQEVLSRFGITPGDSIVALHVRELPNRILDYRSAQLASYFPAIDYLVRSGFKVVRIGSGSMTPLPPQDGLIDLVKEFKGSNQLDFGVLQSSLFLISTMSGPGMLANWMGLPTLTTNVVSLSRTVLSGPAENRYLPKRYVSERGRVITLSETLGSLLGYWQGLHSDRIPKDPVTLDSTPREILEATKEMTYLVSGLPDSHSDLHSRVSDIRRETRAVSSGKFSGSFLSENEGWVQ